MSVPSTTYSDTPIAGISIFAIASPLSGRRSHHPLGRVEQRLLERALLALGDERGHGLLPERVTTASAMSSTPLTIITAATKRSTARIAAESREGRHMLNDGHR